MSTLLSDLREIVREQFLYRELLYQMTMRDLRLRYKQAVMGFGWAIFMPLVNTAVFSVIFMRVAPIETPVPYPVFAFCGLLCWNFFASSLKFSVGSLTGNGNLITKVYFPREVFPISAIFVCLIDFCLAGVVLVALMLWFGITPPWTVIFLPLVVIAHVSLTMGIAFVLAMGNLFFRDVKYLFEIAVSVLMFATSVLYPVDAIGGRLGLVMQLNPLTTIIDAYRAVILGSHMPSSASLVGAAVLSFVALAAGWILFHRAEFRFAESV